MIDALISSLLKEDAFNKAYGKKEFSGIITGARSFLLAALSRKIKKLFVIVPSFDEAQWLKQEIGVFCSDVALEIFPAPDTLPGEGKVSQDISGQRLKVLSELQKDKKIIALAPIRAALYKTSKDTAEGIILEQGGEYDFDKLINQISALGYKRIPAVGERGEFSVRGGILDIYPANSNDPVRVEFFGDRAEEIRIFDPGTQRSKEKIKKAIILQSIEKRETTAIEAIPGDAAVVFLEEEILKFHAQRLLSDAESFQKGQKEIMPYDDLVKNAQPMQTFRISSALKENVPQLFAPTRSFVNEIEEIGKIQGKKIIISEHPSRFQEQFVIPKKLRYGFNFDDYIVLSDLELFNIQPKRPKLPAQKNDGLGEDIKADFNNGDFIVHEEYGIGIYRGTKNIEEGEYVLIEFAEGAKLYVPPQLLGKIEKYVSQDGFAPKLSRLGTASWGNLKSKVKKSLKDLTEDLLLLYSERARLQKEPCLKDDEWQKELENSFPYEETPDQLKAINEIKKDMESGLPMDRLLCGDVGYGKTEVALRAIVKAASSGKQAAVLVPTTILAEQHYHYFKDRLSAFPFNIEALSRFKSAAEQKQIIEKLKTSEIDIVVGTHRLLQKDVSFKNLGLLVIDEEHRFGVAHKEKLKKIKKDTDVLSMTATPIPRTLYFSMSGARDLSLIQTAPADRSPVKTYIAQFNQTLVKEAILRELDRGGQIFFVHNFIETIESVGAELKRLIPELTFTIAHGRMKESELERVVDEFLDKKYDLLLCTAIIESGLDMPSVNTILIDRADRMGLAQLYQLRGRVGRSSVKAYAYLLYHPNEARTQSALERLSAIQEFTSLGSGYKLALRDLEIRGSGNLLGAEQHGHMLSVGFDLYCELLEEAVKEAKGEKTLAPHQVVIDLDVKNALIPASYVEDEQQRIALYRKLNQIGSTEEIKAFKEELRDRFGKIPKECGRIFDYIDLKVQAIKSNVKSIRGKKQVIIQTTSQKVKKIRIMSDDPIREVREAIGLWKIHS